MRLASAIFVYFITAYQPVIAVISDATDETIKLVPLDNEHEPSETVTPDAKMELLSEGARGRMLYENHCITCHESTVHIRARRKATNYQQVGYWVNQRADWLNLGWTDLEKQEVIQYLNERYYKYPVTE